MQQEKSKQDAKIPDVCENTEVFTRKREKTQNRWSVLSVKILFG
jgi:hypothetical protein